MKTNDTRKNASGLRSYIRSLEAPTHFPFPRLDLLLTHPVALNWSRKVTREIFTAARLWLPYKVYYGGGIPLAKMPIGDYSLAFALYMEMERHWQLPEFTEGWRFWLKSEEERDALRNRDANPWENISRDRSRSWDCGYMLGHGWRYRQPKK